MKDDDEVESTWVTILVSLSQLACVDKVTRGGCFSLNLRCFGSFELLLLLLFYLSVINECSKILKLLKVC